MRDVYVLTIFFLFTLISRAHAQCSGSAQTLTASTSEFKVIQSPNYPSSYDNNLACRYLIDSGSAGDTVAISYMSFNLETSYDYLRIYDGNSNSASLITADTRSLSDKFYQSTGQYMYLQFTSDSSVTWSGFKIQYISISSTIQKPSCGSTITVDSSLTNKQYALSTFPSAMTSIFTTLCEWTLSASSGTNYEIIISFTDFDVFGTSTCDDITNFGLAVFEGSTRKYRICNYLPDDKVTLSSAGSGSIKFLAPTINGADRGFILTINYLPTAPVTVPAVPTMASTSSACGSYSNPTQLTVTNVTTYVTSPNYPATYSNNLDCYWVISSSDAISVTPIAVSLDSSDAVYIYDGPSTNYIQIGNFQGTGSFSAIQSSGDSILIRFSTDWSTTNIGFQLDVKEIQATLPSCVPSGAVNVTVPSSGTYTLQSHAGFGSSYYSNNLDSYWLIDKVNLTATLYAKMTTFSLESSSSCVYDYLKVYQGPCPTAANQILFICGEQDSHTYEYANSRYILVHFHTDGSVTSSGWSATLYLSYDTDNSTEDNSTASMIVGIVMGVVFLSIIVIFCCCVFKSRSPSKTTPLNSNYTSNIQQQPPIRKTIPSHVTLKPRPPKIKAEYVIETWKRQRVRERMRNAFEKSRALKDDLQSIISDNDSETETKMSDVSKQPTVPISPPPSYENTIKNDEVPPTDVNPPPTNKDSTNKTNVDVHPEPPTNIDSTNKTDDDVPSEPPIKEEGPSIEELLKVDPDNIPEAFNYVMPPQLQGRE